jgi:methylated-DNA-protein-cysteine methyltransferase-like protein
VPRRNEAQTFTRPARIKGRADRWQGRIEAHEAHPEAARACYTGTMPREQTQRILDALRAVPRGRVASYGQIAMLAGHPLGAGGARDVVRILVSMSEKENLPWWRIVRKDGAIALSPGNGAELQRSLLFREGVAFDASGKVARACFWTMGE